MDLFERFMGFLIVCSILYVLTTLVLDVAQLKKQIRALQQDITTLRGDYDELLHPKP